MHVTRPKTVVRTSVMSPRDEAAFDKCQSYAREWLNVQAQEWELEAPDFTKPLYAGGDASARLIVQSSEESLAFMFAHRDERARDTEWQVHAKIARSGEQAQVDVELIVEGVRPPVIAPLGMPAFLARAVTDPGLLDLWPLTLLPRQITPENAQSFVDFVRSEERQLPIVAFSSPSPLPPEDISRICRRVAGAAHIVNIDVPASFLISDQIGSKFSVYRGAVRVYHQGLGDNPFAIPLFFPQNIARLNEGRPNGPFGPIRFADVLVRTALDRSQWAPSPAVQEGGETTSPAPEKVFSALLVDVAPPVAPPAPVDGTELMTVETEAQTSVADVDERGDDLGRVTAPQASDVAATLKAELAMLREERNALESRLAAAESSLEQAHANQSFYYDAWSTLEEEVQALRENSSTLGLDGYDNISEQDRKALAALNEAFTTVRDIIVRSAKSQEKTQQLREQVETLSQNLAKQESIVAGFRAAKEASATRDDATVQPPTDYHDVDSLAEYLKARHGERLVLHPNLLDALRDRTESVYADSDHLIASLELLGSLHADMKSGVDGGRERFHERRKELAVKYSRALSDESIGRYGQHYHCTYDGQVIDVHDVWHIRNNGTNYAPERMMGLYFFWDEEKKATVVFSGPRKLPTPRDGT